MWIQLKKFDFLRVVLVVHDELILECKKEDFERTKKVFLDVIENVGKNFTPSTGLEAEISDMVETWEK